jgi:hypothetical protein
MVHLDTGLVRDHHGEVTPESVSKQLDEEIDAVLGRRFREQFVQNFKEALANAEQQYGEFGDGVDRGDGVETDGGEEIGVEAPSLEEVAADRLPDTTAEQCAYETCDSQADFMVLTRQTGGATATFATCHDCQQRACLHLVANEIVENDVSEWRRQLRERTDDKDEVSADD